jgi:hypothetical protein
MLDTDSTERFLDQLGPDRWPGSSYQMSQWHYDHLDNQSASYVVCLQDAVLIPAWQKLFAQRLRARRLIEIDAGHQVKNTRPHALAEVLLRDPARG